MKLYSFVTYVYLLYYIFDTWLKTFPLHSMEPRQAKKLNTYVISKIMLKEVISLGQLSVTNCQR